MNDSPNIFAGKFLERMGAQRSDDRWLAQRLKAASTRFLPLADGTCLADPGSRSLVFLKRHQVPEHCSLDDAIFLGERDGHALFAVQCDEQSHDFEPLGEFTDLRALGNLLTADEANFAAQARSLVLWHDSHQFCNRCGERSILESGGYARLCSNPQCETRSFPRLDPAIIVLVHDDEQCLLGRQASWPAGRYSSIAGFVEPGESLEDAVRREVFEESNIAVAEVRYHSSQPWPFPSALMLGFHATPTSSEIILNDGELEDARWFNREELRSGTPKLPSRLSIARRLIEQWLSSAS